MAADCKSAGFIPTEVRILDSGPFNKKSGIGIVVITSAFQADETGSIPVSRSRICFLSALGGCFLLVYKTIILD
jgi:hypothetical protein